MDQPVTSTDPWEGVKPILETLWLKENWAVERIAREMRTYHNFYRVERQYKHQFSTWGWSKNVRKPDIAKAIKACKSRVAAGKVSSQVAVKGKRVDQQKIRRAMKEEIRAIAESIVLVRNQVISVDSHILPFNNNFFLKWNLPYAAMRHSYIRPFDHQSPFDHITPYSDIEITTPSATASPNAAPSPTTEVTRHLIMVDRARLFAHGHHEKLLKLMNGDERKLLSDWLYQYWFFCFKTAKHWGRGPMNWTAKLLEFDERHFTAPPIVTATPQDLQYSDTSQTTIELTPSDLCRWYIHIREEQYDQLADAEQVTSIDVQYDSDDDSTWPTWPPIEAQATLQARLRDALEHNDFSSTPVMNLPIAIPQIAQAADQERSNELLIESLGFSIMGRNVDQIHEICNTLFDHDIDTGNLYPFHLATSFLDGSKSCCDVIVTLAQNIFGSNIRESYLDNHGHTVLDNLMIAIIKSHTSAAPGDVDSNLRNETRFVGEEVDICGRWDADSACIRQLHVNGNASVPSSWKHKFCHTSVQTICHCIAYIFKCMPRLLLLETPSGLYTQRCFDSDCGKKLQLTPLHSLVMTAYHLATRGKDDEDLFGILACALCLIAKGFNPSARADVSVAALLSVPSIIECDHEELTAAGLADALVAMSALQNCSEKVKTGWAVLTGVLLRCEAAHVQGKKNGGHQSRQTDPHTFMGCTEPGKDQLRSHHLFPVWSLCFAVENQLGALWSSAQAEVLSYRRLDDGAPWISANFSMQSLQDQLETGQDVMVGYVERNLLKAHCTCHSFGADFLPILDDAVDPDSANLDIWGRATYGKLVSE